MTDPANYTSKRYLVLIHLTLLVVVTYFISSVEMFTSRIQENLECYSSNLKKSSQVSSPLQNLTEPHRFVFLRLHKVGSSSLVALLKHLANKYKFESYQPVLDVWGSGYPGPFTLEFNPRVYQNYIAGNTAISYKSDIMYEHMRWDIGRKNIYKILKYPSRSETKSITIMRDPMEQFLSTYNYYYYAYSKSKISKFAEKQGKLSCRHGFPYLAFTIPKNENQTTVETFQEKIYLDPIITNLRQRGWEYFRQQPWYFRMENFQSYDLSEISPDHLETEFDLIMLTHRWMESLLQ